MAKITWTDNVLSLRTPRRPRAHVGKRRAFDLVCLLAIAGGLSLCYALSDDPTWGFVQMMAALAVFLITLGYVASAELL